MLTCINTIVSEDGDNIDTYHIAVRCVLQSICKSYERNCTQIDTKRSSKSDKCVNLTHIMLTCDDHPLSEHAHNIDAYHTNVL